MRLVCLLSWFFMFVVGVSACTSQSRDKVYAVVVGIADYGKGTAELNKLQYADRDARRMAALLKSQHEQIHITLLENQEATRQRILDAMACFQKARPEDRVIFYFSGHGNRQGFISYRFQQLRYDDVKQAFKKSKAATKLCIADACLAGHMAPPLAPGNWTNPAGGGADVNIALILATRTEQKALESRRLQGGLFTHFLIRGLKSEADRNQDRVVTIRELYQFTRTGMNQAIQKAALSKAFAQLPLFYGNFSDKLPLAYY